MPSALNLAFLYHCMGRYDEAEAVFIDTLERRRRVFGPTHPGTMTCLQSLSALYRDTDRLSDAVELLEAAYADVRNELGESSPTVLEIGPKLAVMYTELGRANDAEPLFARTVEELTKLLPPEHPYLGRTRSQWAVALHSTGRTVEAITQLEQAYAVLSAAPGQEQAHDARLAARRLADMLDSIGRTEEAAQWRSRGIP